MPTEEFEESPRSKPVISRGLVWLSLVVLLSGWVLTLLLATQSYCSSPFCHQTLGEVILGSVVVEAGFTVLSIVVARGRRTTWWAWGYAGSLATVLLVAWIGQILHRSIQ